MNFDGGRRGEFVDRSGRSLVLEAPPNRYYSVYMEMGILLLVSHTISH